jgi:hypothetical protein
MSPVFNRHDNAFLDIFRKTFGMSSNLRSLCSIAGLEAVLPFDFDWKAQRWNLVDRCDDGWFCSCSVYR